MNLDTYLYTISFPLLIIFTLLLILKTCSHPHCLLDMLLEVLLPPSGVIEIGVLGSLPLIGRER